MRKTPILLRRGPMSGEIMALYRYSRKIVGDREILTCGLNGKQSVSSDFDALMLEELIADDAPDIVGILDGVADGELLTADEKAQVRAFRDRLAGVCIRHNERIESVALSKEETYG